MEISHTINIILCGQAAVGEKVFFDALSSLEFPHRIIHLQRAGQVSTYLNQKGAFSPSVLIFFVTTRSKNYLIQTQKIRNTAKYKNLSILLYDPEGLIDKEEAFVAGVNMYMRKPPDAKHYNTTLRHLFGINYQYLAGQLNLETFFLSA